MEEAVIRASLPKHETFEPFIFNDRVDKPLGWDESIEFAQSNYCSLDHEKDNQRPQMREKAVSAWSFQAGAQWAKQQSDGEDKFAADAQSEIMRISLRVRQIGNRSNIEALLQYANDLSDLACKITTDNLIHPKIVRSDAGSSDGDRWVQTQKVMIEVEEMTAKIDWVLLESPEFEIDFGGFLIQFTTDNRVPHIQNAMDGWGINRRSDFIGKKVTVYLPTK